MKRLAAVCAVLLATAFSANSAWAQSTANMNMAAPVSQNAVYAQMAHLWDQHMEWTYATVAAFAQNSPSLGPNLTRLLQNQQDIGNALKAYYGDAYGTAMAGLLTTHIQDAVPVLVNAQAGNQAALNTAVTNWYANAQQVGALFDAANKYWAANDMQGMWHTHITQTIGYSVDLLQGNVSQSVVDYDAAESHMEQMANMLSFGLVHGLSTQLYPSTWAELMHDSGIVRDAVSDRLASPCADGMSGTGCGTSAWVVPYGSWGRMNGDEMAAGIDHNIRGIFVGADTPVGDNWRVGVVGGYARSDSSIPDLTSSSKGDNYQLGVYAGTRWDAWHFNAGAEFAWHDMDVNRTVINIPGFTDMATAGYHARSGQVFGEVGRDFQWGTTMLTPFARAAWVNLHVDGFSENGDSAAVQGLGTSNSALYTTLGLHASHTFGGSGMTQFDVHGMLGWEHVYGDRSPTANLVFSNGIDLAQTGMPMARNMAMVHAGIGAHLGSQSSLAVDYTGSFGNGMHNNGVMARFAMSF